jgi:hypothetical protein
VVEGRAGHQHGAAQQREHHDHRRPHAADRVVGREGERLAHEAAAVGHHVHVEPAATLRSAQAERAGGQGQEQRQRDGQPAQHERAGAGQGRPEDHRQPADHEAERRQCHGAAHHQPDQVLQPAAHRSAGQPEKQDEPEERPDADQDEPGQLPGASVVLGPALDARRGALGPGTARAAALDDLRGHGLQGPGTGGSSRPGGLAAGAPVPAPASRRW